MEKKTPIWKKAVNLLSPTTLVDDGWLQEDAASASQQKPKKPMPPPLPKKTTPTPPPLPGSLGDPKTLDNNWFITPRTSTLPLTGDKELDGPWYQGMRKAPSTPLNTQSIDENWEPAAPVKAKTNADDEWEKITDEEITIEELHSAPVQNKPEPPIAPSQVRAAAPLEAEEAAIPLTDADVRSAAPEQPRKNTLNETPAAEQPIVELGPEEYTQIRPPFPRRKRQESVTATPIVQVTAQEEKPAPSSAPAAQADTPQSKDIYILPAGNAFAEPRFIHRHMTREELPGNTVVDGEGRKIGTVKEVAIKTDSNRGLIRLDNGETILLHNQDLAPKNKAREAERQQKQAEREAAAAARRAAMAQKTPEDESAFSLKNLIASRPAAPAPSRQEDTDGLIDLKAIAAREEAARREKAEALRKEAEKINLQNRDIAGDNAQWFRNEARQELSAMTAQAKSRLEMKPVRIPIPIAAKPAKKLSARGLRNLVAAMRAETAARREEIKPFEKKGLFQTIKEYWNMDNSSSALEKWARRATAIGAMAVSAFAFWTATTGGQDKAQTQPEGKSFDTAAEFASVPPVPTVRTWNVDRAPGFADEISLHSVVEGQKGGSIRDVYSTVAIGEVEVMTEAQRLAAERRHMKQVLDNTAKEIDAMASSPVSVNPADLKKPMPELFNTASEPVAGDAFMPKKKMKRGLRANTLSVKLASLQTVESGPSADVTPQTDLHFSKGRQVYPTGERAPGIVLETYQLKHEGKAPKAPSSLPGNPLK